MKFWGKIDFIFIFIENQGIHIKNQYNCHDYIVLQCI